MASAEAEQAAKTLNNEPAKSEPAKSEPAKNEPVKSEPVKIEPPKRAPPIRAEPIAKQDSHVRPEAPKAEPLPQKRLEVAEVS